MYVLVPLPHKNDTVLHTVKQALNKKVLLADLDSKRGWHSYHALSMIQTHIPDQELKFLQT